MKLWKRVLLGAVIVGALGAAAAGVVLGGVSEVAMVTAGSGNLVQTVKETGNVQPVQDYDVYTAQGGRVVSLEVEIGQSVEQGQTLLVLENLDLAMQADEVRSRLNQAVAAVAGLEAAVERTELQLADARGNLERMEHLLEAAAVTQVEYEQARLHVEAYERSLKEQQAHLDSTRAQVDGLSHSLQQLGAKQQQLLVTSPAAGTVLRMPVQRNQTLPPGSLVATVAPTDRLEVKADVFGDDLGRVAVGQKVTITAPVLGSEVLSGRVEKIYPRAEEKLSPLGITQRRVPVIISLEDPGNLKPGFEVTVQIETLRRENVLTVPRQAVRTLADGTGQVMLVVDGRVRHQVVETGISDGENVEITHDLEAGDLLVRNGGLDLAEGTRVRSLGN